MEKSSQIAWKIVPLRHFFPLKVVPLIEVLLYSIYTPKNYMIECPATFILSTLRSSGWKARLSELLGTSAEVFALDPNVQDTNR
jgi:hypothetical protein